MTSLPPDYFTELYRSDEDPWGFQSRWYEERKRMITLAVLPEPSYARAFEPGCSIGVLTLGLAGRCASLLATDVAEAPLARARERLRDHAQVAFERRSVPDQWPEGQFDLIVLSEMAYYLDQAALEQLVERAEESLIPAGTLLAVHWRHPVTDYPLSAEQVHAALGRRPGLCRTVEHREEDFLLEVYLRAPAGSAGLSVAARTRMLGP